MIVFVVFIHNTPQEINFHGSLDVLEIPLYAEKTRDLISGVIGRVAVPMFFLISSFLLYSKENNFTTVLKKKLKTILLPYVLWQFLYLLWAFIVQNNPIRESFARSEDRLLNYGILDWLQAFFGNFTKEPSLIRAPYNYPLWFLRDLFILDLLFIPIKNMINKFPFGILIIVTILWIADIQLWVVSPEALLYFIFGYYIVKYNIRVKTTDKIHLIDICIIYSITIVLELFFRDKIPVIHKINILVGMLFFIKISLYIIKNDKLYKKLTWLGGYEFIIFAFHVWVLQYINKAMYIIIPMKGILILFEYFSAVIFTITLCIISGIVLNKIMPKLYKVLTGGRI
jgi:fucose 4-O-acetylase-like acetyltransferase